MAAASSFLRGNFPLRGIRVVELAGLAPGPFCGLILADFGADVVRVDSHGRVMGSGEAVLERGKRQLFLDLKNSEEREGFQRLVAHADVLIDPYRPGVLERLGLCPTTVLLARNPGLIVTRLTGFGQEGPLRSWAGHDINYLAMSGSLSMMGPADRPPYPPINLVADFAGGALTAALGIVMALLERSRTGRGQVIDASMTDGSAYLATFVHDMAAHGAWPQPRGHNLLDGACPFYQCYQTADHRYMAVGSLEPKFYQLFIDTLLAHDTAQPPTTADSLPAQSDLEAWPQLRAVFTRIFALHSQEYWTRQFEQVPDACVTPVVPFQEVASHHLTQPRGIVVDGLPAPAPRLSLIDQAPARAPISAVDLAALLHQWSTPQAKL